MTLGRKLSDQLEEATYQKTASWGLENAQKNAPFFHKTIHDIVKNTSSQSAIVICAGPSLHHQKSIDAIRKSNYQGTLVAVDGSLGHCLRGGLVPDYVITLDPHPERIVRWFGDPHLAERADDDYFRRQDLDPVIGQNEVKSNQQLIELVDKHGPKIKVIASTSIDSSVAQRCSDAQMELLWWNPIYDDYDQEGSVTRKLYELNEIPCMVTGGNCGTAAWIFAHAILGNPNVALVGMDLGYRPNTPLLNTQYYYELKEMLGDSVSEAYIKVWNPYLEEEWLTDPTYFWYRSILLDLAKDAQCQTYNCTEGGIAFGPDIEFTPLNEFLLKFS